MITKLLDIGVFVGCVLAAAAIVFYVVYAVILKVMADTDEQAQKERDV